MRPIALALTTAMILACDSAGAGAGTASLSVGSKTFAANTAVPERMLYNAMSCHGQNVSPEVHWSAVPRATKSLALTSWDPDASVPGGWWHWVLYDIPAQQHSIAEGASAGQSGTTSFHAPGYGGPCPPPGKVHHYRFTVYALDVSHLGASPQTTGPQLLVKMRGHVLAQGVIVGLYKR